MSLSRQAAKIIVKVDGRVRDDLSVMSVRQSMGGHPDTATLQYGRYAFSDGTPSNWMSKFYLQNKKLRDLLANVDCKIIRVDEFGKERLIHTGQMCAVNADLNSSGEHITFTSRLDHHMFGRTIKYPCWTSSGSSLGSRRFIYGDVIFNPTSDSAIIPNMSGGMWPTGGESVLFPEMIDCKVWPRELVGASIDKYRELHAKVGYWTIADALMFVMFACEPSFGCQEIMRPSLEQMIAMFANDDDGTEGPIRVEDLKINLCDPVPTNLDKICAGTSFVWYINYDASPLPMISFMDRSNPKRIDGFVMPTYGTAAHGGFGHTACKSYSFQYDIANESANSVSTVYGPLKIEVTARLFPSWSKTLDKTPIKELIKADDGHDASPEKRRVWRDWVANETGHYSATVLSERGVSDKDAARNTINDAIDTALFFSGMEEVFGPGEAAKFIPCRFFPLEPCLTVGADGLPVGDANSGLVLQYRVATLSEEYVPGELPPRATWPAPDEGWLPISKLLGNSYGYEALDDEAGVRFSTTKEPLAAFRTLLFKYGDNWVDYFQMRVTGTIDVGSILVATHFNKMEDGKSFLRQARQAVVDRSNKFQYSTVDPDSMYFGTDKGSREVDDTKAAQEFVEEATNLYSCATCSGNITLEGLDTNWQPLGMSLDRFFPREVYFDCHPQGLSDVFKNGIYPLVIDVSYEVQRQEITLTLDTYRESPKRFMKRASL